MNGNVTLLQLSDALADTVQSAGEAVALVDARRRRPASGVLIRPGVILTADHTVEREEGIRVLLSGGREMIARLAGRDPGTDLAVLRLSEDAGPAAKLASGEPRVGQMALALGRPAEDGVQASLGIISAIRRPMRGRGGTLEKVLRTDAIPMPGFSGGPLVNGTGEVIGLNTSGMAHGVLIAIPIQEAVRIADVLLEHGRIPRGYLGVRSQVVELSDAVRTSLGRKQYTGLLLVNIEPESPASRGGLLVGDILVGLDGEPVATSDDLAVRLTSSRAGQPSQVQVVRGGQPQQITVTIGESR